MAPHPTAVPTDTAPPGRAGRVTAVQQVYDTVRRRIVTLDLPPGAVLSLKDMAEEFGVSPTPVREALILLSEEGLVDIFPQSRTAVALINVQSAREAHFLRRSVEVEIARLLAAELSDADHARLRDIIQRQKAAQSAGDYTAFTDADNSFHETMYGLAGVAGLWDLIHARRAHLDRLRRLHLPTKGKTQKIIRDHEEILAAISEHDADRAEAAVRAHLKETVSTTEELRSHFPEYFG